MEVQRPSLLALPGPSDDEGGDHGRLALAPQDTSSDCRPRLSAVVATAIAAHMSVPVVENDDGNARNLEAGLVSKGWRRVSNIVANQKTSIKAAKFGPIAKTKR
jgi:hypothetical protein